jgi:hypothetical protein
MPTLSEYSNSRSRDRDHSRPPPQIRTGGVTASGFTLGEDGETGERIRMTDTSRRKPSRNQTAHTSPRQVVALAATAQHRPPEIAHYLAKGAQGRSVHGYRVSPSTPAAASFLTAKNQRGNAEWPKLTRFTPLSGCKQWSSFARLSPLPAGSACHGRGIEHDLRQDFLGFSYGFRPGRSPHQALDAGGRDRNEESELGARCRHPEVCGGGMGPQ